MDPVDREAARRSVPAASEIEISREVFVFVLRTRTGAAELPLDGDRPSVEVDFAQVRPSTSEMRSPVSALKATMGRKVSLSSSSAARTSASVSARCVFDSECASCPPTRHAGE